jgi:hypothetical protein
MKDNPASSFVKVTLNVPRGLWHLLDKLQYLTNENPKEYLEKNALAKELECILSHIPEDLFDVKFLRERYGEGSGVNE